ELPGKLRSADAGEGSNPRPAFGTRIELCACREQVAAAGDSAEAGVRPQESPPRAGELNSKRLGIVEFWSLAPPLDELSRRQRTCRALLGLDGRGRPSPHDQNPSLHGPVHGPVVFRARPV